MPGPHWFKGATSGAFDDGTNWDTGLVPATSEAWGMNRLATRDITSGLNQSAKTFSRIVFHPSCVFGIPTALQCNATELRWCGGGAPVFLSGTFTNISCDSPARTSPGLNLDAVFTTLGILAGWVRLIGTRVAAANSRITVSGRKDAGVEDAKLEIHATTVDLTTNDTILSLDNGTIETIANVDRLIQSGGLFRLGRALESGDPDAAALLLADCLGGSMEWNSTGTITEHHAGGDHKFSLNNSDWARTLTTMTMDGECDIDLSNGHNLTVTNPIRQRGGILRPPVGRTLALAG